MHVKQFAAAVFAAASLLAASQRADAAFIAYIADDPAVTGGGDTVVTDNGAGDSFPGSALTGQINAGALSVAGFTVVTNVAQSKPLVGAAAAPQMTLTFSATTNDSDAHTVYLYASDTGFSGTGNFSLALSGNQFTPSPGTSITGKAYGGNSNANLDLSTLLAQVGPTSGSQFAISSSVGLAPIVNPYGLTIGVAITRTSPGTTSGVLQFVVPEPTTLATASLAGLTLVRRRRR